MRNHPFAVSLLEHVFVTFIAGILLVVLGLLISVPIKILSPVKQAVENFSLSDLYYQADWLTHDTLRQSDEVVVVDVSSLRERDEIAQVLSLVDSCRPAAVGIDLIFTGAHENSAADDFLANVALKIRNTVFSCRMNDYNEESGQYEYLQSSFFVEQFPEPHPRQGYANAVGDSYSTCLRELSVERMCRGERLTSLTASVAETYLRDSIPIQRDKDYFIDFSHIGFLVIPYDSVTLCADKIKDRIVLVGLATSGEDLHVTPIGMMAGVIVQAYAVQTLIQHRGVHEFGGTLYILMVILITFLTVFWQYEWIRFFQNRKSLFLYFFSEAPLSLVTFFWLALLALITYIFYNVGNTYISMGYVLVIVVLVDEARDIYIAMLKTLNKSKRTDLRIINAVKGSVYLRNLE